MKLTVPNHPQNKHGQSKIFYVSSESRPNSTEATHIVVQHGLLYFCDCRDFMVRRLPLLGMTDFSLCKHGKFVQATYLAAQPGVTITLEKTPEPKATKPRKFAIFYYVNGKTFRSIDIPGVFETFAAAKNALDAFNKKNGSYMLREVREL